MLDRGSSIIYPSMYLVRLIAKSNVGMFTLVVALSITSALFPVALMYLNKILVDMLSKSEISEALTIGMTIGLFSVFQSILSYFLNFLSQKHYYAATSTLAKEYSVAMSNVKYFEYEDIEFIQLAKRVERDVAKSLPGYTRILSTLLGSATAFAAMTYLTLKISPVFVILAFASVLPSYFSSLKSSAINFEFSKSHTDTERRAAYYYSLFANKMALKDHLSHNAFEFLTQKWEKEYNSYSENHLSLHRSRLFRQFFSGLPQIALLGSSALYVVYLYGLGRASLGDLVLISAGVQSIQNNCLSILDSVNSIYALSLKSIEFIHIHKRSPQPIHKKQEFFTMELCGVGYQYPGSEKEVLKDINIGFSAGQLVQIVGENGSGKSTAARIISGLLNPTSGTILINGMPSITDVRSSIVSFVEDRDLQYAMTLNENIYLGRSHSLEIVTSGFRLLPETNGRTLGKMFHDSIDFSSGQWQMTKILRGMMNEASVFIFDEPLTFLDDDKRTWFNDAVKALIAKGKAVVIISHESIDIIPDHMLYIHRKEAQHVEYVQ